MSDEFNTALGHAVVATLWLTHTDIAERDRQIGAMAAALAGIAPRDELEGMLAGQLIAANAAAIECYRRAMIGAQTFEGRKENLNQANRLSRTYATLLEALNRHRGRSTQQKVTVEHVHVHAGGQALVGALQPAATPGGGAPSQNRSQPHAQAHAQALAHAPVAPLPSTNPEREPLPLAGDAERPLPHARRRLARSTQG